MRECVKLTNRSSVWRGPWHIFTFRSNFPDIRFLALTSRKTSSFQNLMPGGVSSPVRAFKSVGGEPIVFEKVKGAYAWDVDGNKYIDYVCTWGPSIVGHANDEVLDALRETLVKGM